MKNILLLLLILVGFSSGCTMYQIDSQDATLEYYAPKTSIDEVMYVEKPDKAYTEIATVSVTTERRQSLESVLPKLKQEAGILGADAITDVQKEAPSSWKKIARWKFFGNAYLRTTYTSKAIVWNK
jgi:hypothetical protein